MQTDDKYAIEKKRKVKRKCVLSFESIGYDSSQTRITTFKSFETLIHKSKKIKETNENEKLV